MKRISLVLGAFLLLAASPSGWAGDLGGGGGLAARRSIVYKLPIEKKEILIRQESIQGAYNLWIDTLTDEERERVLEEAFINHVLPQLK